MVSKRGRPEGRHDATITRPFLLFSSSTRRTNLAAPNPGGFQLLYCMFVQLRELPYSWEPIPKNREKEEVASSVRWDCDLQQRQEAGGASLLHCVG
jgi:hypothetical protein